MIKKLLILLIVSCFSSQVFGGGVMFDAGGVEAGGETYPNILFNWEAENSHDADRPSGLTASPADMTFQTSPKLAGTYSALVSSSGDDQEWSNIGDLRLDRAEGRLGFWLFTGASIGAGQSMAGAYYDANNFFKVTTFSTTGVNFTWTGNGVAAGAYINPVLSVSTAYYIELAWSVAGELEIYIDGVSQSTTDSGTYTAMTSVTSDGVFTLGNTSGAISLIGASYDQVRISDDATQDLNSIKLVTGIN